jgi:hypothetical protein
MNSITPTTEVGINDKLDIYLFNEGNNSIHLIKYIKNH